MDTKLVLRKNPNIVTRMIDGETILLPLLKSTEEINCIYTLNKSASRVWELINGKRTLAQIGEAVVKDFDVTPAKVQDEINVLIKDLKEISALMPAGKEALSVRTSVKKAKVTVRKGGA